MKSEIVNCPACNKQFSYRTGLRRHAIRQHRSFYRRDTGLVPILLMQIMTKFCVAYRTAKEIAASVVVTDWFSAENCKVRKLMFCVLPKLRWESRRPLRRPPCFRLRRLHRFRKKIRRLATRQQDRRQFLQFLAVSRVVKSAARHPVSSLPTVVLETTIGALQCGSAPTLTAMKC
jgi:hypothetical protein